MDKAKLEKLKRQSREEAATNVVQKGSVHFRLDPEMMTLLLEEANRVRVPFGVFARMLMIEALVSRKSAKGMPESSKPATQSRRRETKAVKRKYA